MKGATVEASSGIRAVDYQELTRKLIDAFALTRYPIGFHYQDEHPPESVGFKKVGAGCLVALLKRIDDGKVVALSSETPGCFGAGFFCGFSGGVPFPGQAEYVSTGIEGMFEGEHYKIHVDLVRDLFTRRAPAPAPARWLVLQRLDQYADECSPDAVIFLVRPDSLAGLHTLANIDKGADNGVVIPFTSGCGALINEPLLEKRTGTMRAVVGLLDPSARPYEDPGIISFTVPTERLLELVPHLDKGFLVHKDWLRLRRRMVASPENIL